MYKFHIDYHFLESPICYGNTVLVQLGRLYFEPSSAVAKHAHTNLFELTVVNGGRGTVLTNDIPTPVTVGDIYLSYPGDLHEIRSSEEEPLKYDFFAFNTQNERLKGELRRIISSYCSCTDRVFRDSQVNSLISTAIAEFSSKQAFHEEILSSILEQVIYYTVRSFSADKVQLQSKYTVSSDELCFQMMHYIDTHIYSIGRLEQLSDIFNYNYSYLSDLFRRTTGNTLASYYQSRRLDVAGLLIAEGKLSVSRIAEMLGYSSLYSFSKAFKSKYGISPKNYKSEKNY